MQKTCLKCGLTADVDDHPHAECPGCGAIYARVTSSAGRQSASRHVRQAPRHGYAYPSPMLLRGITIAVAVITLLPATIAVVMGALPGYLGIIVWLANLTTLIVVYLATEAARAIFATAAAAEDAQQSLRELVMASKRDQRRDA